MHVGTSFDLPLPRLCVWVQDLKDPGELGNWETGMGKLKSYMLLIHPMLIFARPPDKKAKQDDAHGTSE